MAAISSQQFIYLLVKTENFVNEVKLFPIMHLFIGPSKYGRHLNMVEIFPKMYLVIGENI